MSNPSAGQIERWVVAAVVIAAIVAVALVAFHAFNIAIPAFVVTIGWILVVAFVAVAAIRFLMRM